MSAPLSYPSFLGGKGLTQEEIDEALHRYREDQAKKVEGEGEEALSFDFKELIELIRQLPSMHTSLDIPKSQVEGIYNLGYHAYNQARYKQATVYFRLAYILDPANEKYLFSLGLSLEKNRQYFEAATAYLLWGQLEDNSPLGHFRAGICFLEMDNSLAADLIFSEAIARCGEEELFTPIKERATLFRMGLQATLQESQELKEEKP